MSVSTEIITTICSLLAVVILTPAAVCKFTSVDIWGVTQTIPFVTLSSLQLVLLVVLSFPHAIENKKTATLRG